MKEKISQMLNDIQVMRKEVFGKEGHQEVYDSLGRAMNSLIAAKRGLK